jgi:antirestriction protein ArdC
MVSNARREYAVQRREQPALLWLQRRAVVDGAGGQLSLATLLDFQAGFGVGRQRPQGRARHQVYFVRQLQVHDQGEDDSTSSRLIPMMREYMVFNVDQCDNLPDNVIAGKPMRVRNPDARDELTDAFLHSTGADIREGHGEAMYVPSRDFISMPAFAGFKSADPTMWRSTN